MGSQYGGNYCSCHQCWQQGFVTWWKWIGLYLAQPSQEVWFFHHRSQAPYPRQGPKILSLGKWWNGCQHIPLSSSFLPCAEQEPKCQGINPDLMYSRGGLIKLLLVLCQTPLMASQGWMGLLLSRVNVTDSSVPDSGMEILVSESYGKHQEI